MSIILKVLVEDKGHGSYGATVIGAISYWPEMIVAILAFVYLRRFKKKHVLIFVIASIFVLAPSYYFFADSDIEKYYIIVSSGFLMLYGISENALLANITDDLPRGGLYSIYYAIQSYPLRHGPFFGTLLLGSMFEQNDVIVIALCCAALALLLARKIENDS